MTVQDMRLKSFFAVAAFAAAAFADVTADYAQDGLVAFWDGVENAGAGAHLATNFWRDVVGGRKFSLDKVKVEANRMVFNGSACGGLAPSNTVDSFNCATNGTIEIVLAAAAGGNMIPLMSSSASGVALGSYNGCTILACDRAQPTLPWQWKLETNTITVCYRERVPVAAATNGLACKPNAGRCDQWGCGNPGTVIGCRHGGGERFNGSIFAIRVYDRNLTPVEIARNRAADERRFIRNDLRPRSAALEVAGAPEPFAAPSPAYGVKHGVAAGEKIVCTAAAWTNAEETLSTVTTGWKLFDVDGNLVSEGAGATCDYVHPTPAAYRRLEWTFRKIPLNHYDVSPSDDLAQIVRNTHDYAVIELGPGTHALADTLTISNELTIVGRPDGSTFVSCANGAPFVLEHPNLVLDGLVFSGKNAVTGPRGGTVTNCLVWTASPEIGFGGGAGLMGGFSIISNVSQMAADPATWKRCNAPYAAYERIENTHSSAVERVLYNVEGGQEETRWSIDRCWVYQGEMKLPAGESCFMLSIDDRARLWIDGKSVLATENSWRGECSVLNEKEGWHAFRLAVYNAKGAAGPTDEDRFGFAFHAHGEKWRIPEESLFRRAKRGAICVASGVVPESATYPRPGTYLAARGASNLVCRAAAVATNEQSGVAYAIKGWRLTAAEGGAVVAEGEGAEAVVPLDAKNPCTLAWTWTPIAYRLLAETCENGAIEPAFAWVKAGESVAVKATPNEGCWFSSWTKGVDPAYKLEEEVEVVVEKPTSVAAEFFKKKAKNRKQKR